MRRRISLLLLALLSAAAAGQAADQERPPPAARRLIPDVGDVLPGWTHPWSGPQPALTEEQWRARFPDPFVRLREIAGSVRALSPSAWPDARDRTAQELRAAAGPLGSLGISPESDTPAGVARSVAGAPHDVAVARLGAAVEGVLDSHHTAWRKVLPTEDGSWIPDGIIVHVTARVFEDVASARRGDVAASALAGAVEETHRTLVTQFRESVEQSARKNESAVVRELARASPDLEEARPALARAAFAPEQGFRVGGRQPGLGSASHVLTFTQFHADGESLFVEARVRVDRFVYGVRAAGLGDACAATLRADVLSDVLEALVRRASVLRER